MKIDMLIPAPVLCKMPVSFQYLRPIDRTISIFSNRHIAINRYQSLQCSVNPPLKPISKII